MWEAEKDDRRPKEGHDAVSRAQVLQTTEEAVAGIEDGSTVLVGGFGLAGMPFDLVDALIRQGAKDLTIVSNNAGNGDVGLAALLAAGQVRKVMDDMNGPAPGHPGSRQPGTVAAARPGGLDQRYLHHRQAHSGTTRMP